MASLLKEQQKAKGKRKADAMDVDEREAVPTVKKPRNKQRVLMLSSRGINHRMRHLMNDLEALLPHVKKGELMRHPSTVPIPNVVSRRLQAGLEEPSKPSA